MRRVMKRKGKPNAMRVAKCRATAYRRGLCGICVSRKHRCGKKTCFYSAVGVFHRSNSLQKKIRDHLKVRIDR
mgnify:CR=1 FL=1